MNSGGGACLGSGVRLSASVVAGCGLGAVLGAGRVVIRDVVRERVVERGQGECFFRMERGAALLSVSTADDSACRRAGRFRAGSDGHGTGDFVPSADRGAGIRAVGLLRPAERDIIRLAHRVAAIKLRRGVVQRNGVLRRIGAVAPCMAAARREGTALLAAEEISPGIRRFGIPCRIEIVVQSVHPNDIPSVRGARDDAGVNALLFGHAVNQGGIALTHGGSVDERGIGGEFELVAVVVQVFVVIGDMTADIVVDRLDFGEIRGRFGEFEAVEKVIHPVRKLGFLLGRRVVGKRQGVGALALAGGAGGIGHFSGESRVVPADVVALNRAVSLLHRQRYPLLDIAEPRILIELRCDCHEHQRSGVIAHRIADESGDDGFILRVGVDALDGGPCAPPRGGRFVLRLEQVALADRVPIQRVDGVFGFGLCRRVGFADVDALDGLSVGLRGFLRFEIRRGWIFFECRLVVLNDDFLFGRVIGLRRGCGKDSGCQKHRAEQGGQKSFFHLWSPLRKGSSVDYPYHTIRTVFSATIGRKN